MEMRHATVEMREQTNSGSTFHLKTSSRMSQLKRFNMEKSTTFTTRTTYVISVNLVMQLQSVKIHLHPLCAIY